MKSKKLRRGLSTLLSLSLSATLPGVQALSVVAQEDDPPTQQVPFDEGTPDDLSAGQDQQFETDTDSQPKKSVMNMMPFTDLLRLDKLVLNQAIEYAEAQIKAGCKDGLNKLVLDEFETTLARAKELNENADAASEDVLATWENLVDVMHLLDFKSDKSGLKNLVAECDNVKKEDYVQDAAWTEFSAALEEAKGILESETALNDSIQASVDRLSTAKSKLVRNDDAAQIAAYKSLLQRTIDNADKLVADGELEHVIPPIKNAFNETLAHAKELVKDDKATVTDLKNTWERLVTLIQSTSFTGDKTGLKAMLDNCEANITEDKYEQDAAWEAYKTELAAAKAVYADENSLDAKIQDAMTKLQAAIDKLTKKENLDSYKAILKQTIDYADAIVADDGLKGVNEVVVKYFNEALTSAKAVYDKKDATLEEITGAWTTLTDALHMLEFKSEKDTLRALVEDCKANIKGEDYIDDAEWKEYTAALAEAEEILASDTALNQRIEASVVRLNKAKDSLHKVPVVVVDKDLLDKSIAYAEEKVAEGALDNLNEVVKAAFEKALAAAKDVSANPDATQAEVDAAWRNLTEMIHMLDFKADKRDLLDAIKEAASINSADWKQDANWETFQAALAKANEVAADKTALQDSIDAAANGLRDAIKNLTPADAQTVNKSHLDQAIVYANKIVDGDGLAGVNEFVKEQFLAALETAKGVSADLNATQDEVNNAWTNLVEWIQMLDFKSDKTELDKAIAEADAINGDDWKHDAQWDAFQAAFAAAKEVSSSATALQDRIDAATKDLRDAMGALNANDPVVTVDKRLLQQTSDYAHTVVTEDVLAGLNELVAKEVTEAMAQADAVLADKDATQDEVNAAWTRLTNALQMLDFKADKTDLEEAIALAHGKDPEAYEHDDAWTAFEAALAEAEAVAGDKKALQPRIDAANVALRAAMDALNEKVPVTVNKTLLEEAITRAAAEIAAGKLEGVNEVVAAKFMEAYETAQTVFDNADATQAEVDEAWQTLVQMIQMLDFKSDKTALEDAIADAEEINGDLYEHDDAWTAFQKALGTAKDVLGDKYALQGRIDEATIALRTAMDALNEKGPEVTVEKSLLKQAIDAAEAEIAAGSLEGLNEVVKAKFMEAYEAAQTVYDKADATQAEVNDAWSTLVKMIQMLEFKADKTELDAAIKEAEEINGEDYKQDDAWTAFQEALNAAKDVAASDTALQDSIDAATDALRDAMGALNKNDQEVTVDKSLLEKAIARAEAEMARPEYENVHPIVKEALTKALAEAKTVFDNDKATQDEVNDAWQKLVEVIQMLDFTADKSELEKAIADAGAINGDDYKHDDAWTAFEEALANAKAVNDDEFALQARIDEAIVNLRAAMAALNKNDTEVEVDKSVLKQTIDYAKEQDTTNVNELVKEKFDAALAAAEAVFADENATQDEVNKAYKDLVDAIHMLDFKADKTELDSAIADAEAIDGDAYEHDDAWTAFEEALADAKAVQADKKALQDRIDEATDALRAAMDALNEKAPDVEVDKSLLNKAISYADNKVAEGALEGVNEVVVEKFNAALAAAKAVSADDNATQDEVNDAWRELVKMIQMLDFKADKTELEKAIADADALDADAYEHDDAWTAYEAALAEAKAVQSDKTALQAEIDEATVALRAAMDALNEKAPEVTVDKSLLDEAIAEANAQIEAGCLENLNTIVKDKFLAALETAGTVFADDNATQDEVDDAWRELVKMLQMLDFKSDKTELDKAIEDAEAIDADAYEHDDAWDAFQAALDTAKEVSASDTALQDRIDAATDALRDAMNNLNEIMPEDVDKSELQKAIADADAIDADAYEHDDAWTAFEAALEAARGVNADENATQAKVDEATVNLRAAMDALNEKAPEVEVNKALLEATIKYAHDQIDAGALEHLNELVKDKFLAALDTAEAVFADDNATQDEVNEAWRELAKMIQMLDFKSDKTDLEQAIKDAEAIDGDAFEHDDNWTAFEEALANAKDVLGDKTALQDRIDEACNALRDAIDKLTAKVEFDLSQLNTAIAKANKIFNDSAAFKSGTPAWSDFEAKLEAAKSVHDDPQSQDEINQAARDLSNSMIRLRLSASKDRLDNMGNNPSEK